MPTIRKSLNMVLDADIIVDYTAHPEPAVSFSNQTPAITMKGILEYCYFAFVATICIYIFTQEAFVLLIVPIFWTIAYILSVMHSVPQLSRLSKIYLKYRTRRARRTVTFCNPEYPIVYETRHAEPLFDLEYSGNIRLMLKRVSLIKSPKLRRRLHESRLEFIKRAHCTGRRTAMLVEFVGRANGELVIKEY